MGRWVGSSTFVCTWWCLEACWNASRRSFWFYFFVSNLYDVVFSSWILLFIEVFFRSLSLSLSHFLSLSLSVYLSDDKSRMALCNNINKTYRIFCCYLVFVFFFFIHYHLFCICYCCFFMCQIDRLNKKQHLNKFDFT